jgi:hypothetical protein
MKILSRIAIGAALVMLVASAQPAQAACGAPYLINPVTAAGDQSFVVANPEWCGDPGCYYQASLNQSFQAFFWSLDTGNPAPGLGDDNGGFDPHYNWLYVYTYYYAGAPYYGAKGRIAGIGGAGALSWQSAPAIDGCVMNSGATELIDGTECTCLMVTDQWDWDFGGPLGPQPAGLFAVMSARTNASGTFDISQNGADFVLKPIPKPTITDSVRNGTNFDIDRLSVNVPAPVEGVYQKDGCDCFVGYKVYGKLQARGSAPPTDRDAAGWTLLNLDGGAPQVVTPLGGPVDLELLGQCASNQDLYLGTALVMSSGYETPLVSADSTRVECGPDLANPASIRPRVNPATPELRQNPRGAKRGR